MMKNFFKKVAHLLISAILMFSLLSLFLYDGTSALRLNIITAIFIPVLLVVLFFAERKLGYFAAVKNRLFKERDYLTALMQDGKKLRLLLHIFNLAVTLLYVGAVLALIMLGYFSKVSILSVFAGALSAVALQVIDRIVSGRGGDHAKLFFIIAVLVGMMMCYTIPPTLYVSWDDETHFRRAYDWVHIFEDERDGEIDRVLTFTEIPVDRYISDPQAFVLESVKGDSAPSANSPAMSNPYTAIGYIPMMAVMALFALLGTDVVTLIVACRLANVLAYALIIYLGIRKLKSGACIFSAVCLFPSALYLACSINYDFWLTAWFAYGFAYLISVLQRPEKKLEIADIVKILIAFFLACGPKAIYCVMLLPLMLLPKSKFTDPKQAKRFRVAVVILIGFIVATLLVPGLLVSDLYTDHRGGADVSTGGQVSFILSNPFKYAYILLKFLSEFCSLSQLNTWSAYFAYLGNPHVFFGTISGFLLLYCTFTDRKEDDAYEQMQATRWVTLLVCFVQLVLVATSLYVGFTPVGAETINGVSYRYIFPLLIPFCFFLAPSKIKCKMNTKFQSAFVFGGLAFNLLFAFFNSYIGRF